MAKGEPKVCYLNRKPYWDRDAHLRQRFQCCGKRDSAGGCTLTKQPEGALLTHDNGDPIKRGHFPRKPVAPAEAA